MCVEKLQKLVSVCFLFCGNETRYTVASIRFRKIYSGRCRRLLLLLFFVLGFGRLGKILIWRQYGKRIALSSRRVSPRARMTNECILLPRFRNDQFTNCDRSKTQAREKRKRKQTTKAENETTEEKKLVFFCALTVKK